MAQAISILEACISNPEARKPGPGPDPDPGPGRQILFEKHPGRVRAGEFLLKKIRAGPEFRRPTRIFLNSGRNHNFGQN